MATDALDEKNDQIPRLEKVLMLVSYRMPSRGPHKPFTLPASAVGPEALLDVKSELIGVGAVGSLK